MEGAVEARNAGNVAVVVVIVTVVVVVIVVHYRLSTKVGRVNQPGRPEVRIGRQKTQPLPLPIPAGLGAVRRPQERRPRRRQSSVRERRGRDRREKAVLSLDRPLFRLARLRHGLSSCKQRLSRVFHAVRLPFKRSPDCGAR